MEEHLIQGTKDWLNYRRQFVTATDSIVLMGVAPSNWNKTSPHDVWLSKQPNYIEEEPNFYMNRGKQLEEEALREFEKQTGFLMSPKVLTKAFMLASLDGLSIDEDVACEIKCPGQKDHLHAIYSGVPEKYIPQIQHQIEVTGLDKIYYMSYRPEHETPMVILEVKRDQDYIDKLVQVERKFYEEHMLTGIAPDCAIIAPKLIDSDTWISISEEYKYHDREINILQKRKDELRDYLVQLAGEENAQGNGIILTKVERKGIIPYANIPEVKQMDLEKYRKPSTSYWQVKESNEHTT